eukprot:50482_1
MFGIDCTGALVKSENDLVCKITHYFYRNNNINMPIAAEIGGVIGQFIDKFSKLKMKLTPILDQMSPCTKRFQMITHQLIVDVMETFVDTHGEMEAVIRLVMAHALKKT